MRKKKKEEYALKIEQGLLDIDSEFNKFRGRLFDHSRDPVQDLSMAECVIYRRLELLKALARLYVGSFSEDMIDWVEVDKCCHKE